MRGRRRMPVIYVALNKKLLVDIANQNKLLNTIMSVDASNYFDRVIYLIAGMICQYFRLLLDYIIAFFTTIQGMKMYLLTSFGISQTFYTRNKIVF